MLARTGVSTWGLVQAFLLVAAALLLGALVASAAEPEKEVAKATPVAKLDGREIFNREWLPNDKRSHGGDGLGPVFNDTSCVACHNQGGVGGGGAASKNVTLSTPFVLRHENIVAPRIDNPVVFVFRSIFGSALPKPVDVAQTKERLAAQVKRDRAALAKIHPSLATARSLVIHRFGTSPNYESWAGSLTGGRAFATQTFSPNGELLEATTDNIVHGDTRRQLLQQQAQMARFQQQQQAQVGEFFFVSSQRNTTALFGIGALDQIPEEVLVAAAAQKHEGFPEVTGRVNRLKSGKAGRFGWKAQEASLSDFVLTACAVELGLNVPERQQAADPQRPDYKPAGLDLTAEECTSLISFIGSLPAPTLRNPAGEQEKEYLGHGKRLFATTGFATCHTPDLGKVSNVYSDLLLHDLGSSLSDSASYGGSIPNSPESDDPDVPLANLAGHQQLAFLPDGTMQLAQPDEKTIGPLRQEWRTPPLWGVRDSAPYMHDGRADTLEQAIAFHDGESAQIARKFFALKHEEQQQVIAFLKSLTAPE